jgi:hypothetical protein
MRHAAAVALVVATVVRADPPAADPLQARTAQVYAAFTAAAEAIRLYDGTTVDRLTLLARLASEPDPANRRRLFGALAPVWSTIAGEPGSPSPYDELVRLRRDSWAAKGTLPPFEAAARDWGIEPATLEAWLVRVLEAWRDTLPAGDVEPWDEAYIWGEADRDLEAALPRDRMIDVALRWYGDLGAPPKDLGVKLDLKPRRGKDPVSNTDFVSKPERSGKSWSRGRTKISASYAEGGLGRLYELMHELGHAAHISAIRPVREADLDWPDSDVLSEALADMLGVTAYDGAWQQRYLATRAPDEANLRARLASTMMDVCWALFEWRVHRDPDADPNAVWTALTHDYLRIAPHPELPWWAVRGQLADSPGYLMNYALGAIVTEDLRARVLALRGPTAFNAPRPGLYLWLAKNLYRFGKERSSRDVVEGFLGRPVAIEPLLTTISSAKRPE